MSRFFLTLIFTLVLSGCALFSVFTPPEINKHPDAPVLLLEVQGEYARVAVYDKAKNRLIEYGWVPLKELESFTVSKFDWEKFILEQGKK